MTQHQWIGIGTMVGVGLAAAGLALLILRRITGFMHDRSSRYQPTTLRLIRRAGVLITGAVACLPIYDDLDLPNHAQLWVGNAIEGIAIVGFVLLGMALWDAVCEAIISRTSDPSERAERLLVPVTRKLVRGVIVIAGFLVTLAAFGVNVGAVVAGLGIGGVALALAAKDSVENLFGSLTILFDMPFALNDWIKIEKVEGSVEQINLRSTRIRTAEDTLITLPNANLIRASVENFGSRRYRRQRFVVRLHMDSPVALMDTYTARLNEFLLANFGFWPEKTIAVVGELGDNYVGVVVTFFTDAPDLPSELRDREKAMREALSIKAELGLASPVPPTQRL